MEITFMILLLISVVINAITSYFNHKILKRRIKLVNERQSSLSALYIPVLEVMRRYYVDREDYMNAKECKDLMKAILDSDQKSETL